MRTVKVYRFEYFDYAKREQRVSDDFATREAIAAMGATLLPRTECIVDERLLAGNGLVLARNMPPCLEDE